MIEQIYLLPEGVQGMGIGDLDILLKEVSRENRAV